MKITENFTYIGTQQNFERDSYATLAEMKAVVDKRMPDIFTATCKETGKFYIYNKNNEIDEILGKWRELSIDSADYAKKTDIPTTLPANGGNADTVNNHTVESNVPADAVFTDTTYDDTEVKAEIAKNGIPVGCIFPFAGINLPVGYLLCNGASYAVADYPDLYAVIGNTYGGDTENFNVPDYRETVLVGVGENTTDTIASHDVYELGEFKDDQLQRITGDFEAGNRNTSPHTSGAFSTKSSQYTWFALSETETNSSSVEFDSSKVTRSGTTTHGKQKGVTYIIKAR